MQRQLVLPRRSLARVWLLVRRRAALRRPMSRGSSASSGELTGHQTGGAGMRDRLELYEQREVLGRRQDQRALVQPILEELAERLGFDQAFIARVDPKTHATVGIACVGIPDDSFDAFQIRPHDVSGVLNLALEQGRSLI